MSAKNKQMIILREKKILFVLFFFVICILMPKQPQHQQQQQRGTNHHYQQGSVSTESSVSFLVSASLYIDGTAYSYQPAYYGAVLRDSRIRSVKMQYLTNHLSLCYNRTTTDTGIVVVDNTNSTNSINSNSTTVTTTESQFIVPSSTENDDSVDTGMVEADEVGLLLYVSDECDTIQQVLNAQAIHSSITVVLISNNIPNSEQELYLDYEHSMYYDIRVFVSTITNRTGTILRQYIDTVNDSDNVIAVSGGPIIYYDSLGTFYQYGNNWGNNDDYRNTTTTDTGNTSVGFVIAVIMVHLLVFIGCIVGSSFSSTNNTNENESDNTMRNNNTDDDMFHSNLAIAAAAAAGTASTLPTIGPSSTTRLQPQQQQQQSRLLTKREVQQFITILPTNNTKIITRYQNNINNLDNSSTDIENVSTTIQLSQSNASTTATTTAVVTLDNEYDTEANCCAICLTELVMCCTTASSSTSVFNDTIPTTGSDTSNDNNVTGNHNNNNNGTTTTPTVVQIARLPCSHIFHMKCIVPWLTERQSHCPLCKYDVSKYCTSNQQQHNTKLLDNDDNDDDSSDCEC